MNSLPLALPLLMPATLADCDAAWAKRGVERPRYQIVVSQAEIASLRDPGGKRWRFIRWRSTCYTGTRPALSAPSTSRR